MNNVHLTNSWPLESLTSFTNVNTIHLPFTTTIFKIWTPTTQGTKTWIQRIMSRLRNSYRRHLRFIPTRLINISLEERLSAWLLAWSSLEIIMIMVEDLSISPSTTLMYQLQPFFQFLSSTDNTKKMTMLVRITCIELRCLRVKSSNLLRHDHLRWSHSSSSQWLKRMKI